MTTGATPTLTTTRPSTLRLSVAGLVFLVAVVAVRLLYTLMESQQVNITGDEPSYVMMAQALLHGTLHILPTIQHDLSARVFGNTYPPTATVQNVEAFHGPTGVISPFEPGLGALLTPFVAVFGAVQGAILGMICINAAGLIWLHQRASRLFGLSPLAEGVLGVAFVLPAILVGATQIYPDLPAGILIAMACLEIAAIEVEKRTSSLSVVIVAGAVSYLPWLQPKNLVPCAFIVVGYLFVAGRLLLRERRPDRLPIGVLVSLVVMVASVIAFFLYNHHYFGRWLGLPEPPVRLTHYGIQLTLGLLFDKDQGLFVQVPWSLLALAALIVLGWRRLPAALAVSVLSFGAVLVLNGTYTSNPYGGGCLAGRFMWTLIPISLPWLALALDRAEQAGRSLWAALAVVVLAFLWQGYPIVRHEHDWYNPIPIHYVPWPTWWKGLRRVLPQFGRTSHVIGIPGWAFPFELLLAAALVAVVLVWALGRTRQPIGEHART